MGTREWFTTRLYRWFFKRAYERGYARGWNEAEKLAFHNGWEQAKEAYSHPKGEQ